MVVLKAVSQSREFVRQNASPGGVAVGMPYRCTVGETGFAVQLVGQLGQDHVVAVVGIANTSLDVIPGQDDLAIVPGFTQ